MAHNATTAGAFLITTPSHPPYDYYHYYLHRLAQYLPNATFSAEDAARLEPNYDPFAQSYF
jgi:hypothetical protein